MAEEPASLTFECGTWQYSASRRAEAPEERTCRSMFPIFWVVATWAYLPEWCSRQGKLLTCTHCTLSTIPSSCLLSMFMYMLSNFFQTWIRRTRTMMRKLAQAQGVLNDEQHRRAPRSTHEDDWQCDSQSLCRLSPATVLNEQTLGKSPKKPSSMYVRRLALLR